MRNALLWVMSVFVLCSTSLSQEGSDAFSGLSKYINQTVTVETPDGKLTGQLLRVEESRLVVYRDGSPTPIPRESVRKVTRQRSRHTAAWVGGFAGAGFGLGLLAGIYAFDDTKNGNSKVAALAAAEAGIGAAIGYGLSRIGRNPVLFESTANAAVRPSTGMQREDAFEAQTAYLHRSTKLVCVVCGGAAAHLDESSAKTLPSSSEISEPGQEGRCDHSGLGDSNHVDATASVGRIQ